MAEPTQPLVRLLASRIRWRQWRIDPMQVIASAGNPSAAGVYGCRVEGTGYPAAFNIPRDPREEMNKVGTEAWVIVSYMKIITQYQASLREHPNPPMLSLRKFWCRTLRPACQRCKNGRP